MKIVIQILLFTLISLSTACNGSTRLANGIECGHLIDTYFQLSAKERTQKFPTQDIEKQYQIYMCGSQAIEPPVMGLAGVFASEGGKVVPYLESKLRAANDDLTVRDLLLVFRQMEVMHTYDVHSNSELISLMRDKVSKMKDPQWKKIAESSLHDISN